MIIFSLEALADDSHRRHFIEPNMNELRKVRVKSGEGEEVFYLNDDDERWIPDYDAYTAACGEDKPINPVCKMNELFEIPFAITQVDIQIWSVGCESLREVIDQWLTNQCIYHSELKMRPEGDTTPAHELKEKWLDERYEVTKWGSRHDIEYVFESDPESVAMWKRCGVFVFDCRQGE